VRDRGRLNRWLRLSSHPVGPSLPLVAALGGRDLLQHPERRAPRLGILALGVPGEELIPRLTAAIGGVDPSRVIVLTDSLAFAELRRLGVAFERLPLGEHVRGVTLDRLRDQAGVLLDGRKPMRIVSVGSWGEEVLGIGPEGG
jgi:hypothetical protein